MIGLIEKESLPELILAMFCKHMTDTCLVRSDTEVANDLTILNSRGMADASTAGVEIAQMDVHQLAYWMLVAGSLPAWRVSLKAKGCDQ